ncbi:hypothetical protein C0J52_04998 [Blattella germanica]|nr:hypothetical protein C0J52_04998 [Blattella germanica]
MYRASQTSESKVTVASSNRGYPAARDVELGREVMALTCASFEVNKQPYPMECGVSATYPSTNGGAPNGIMTDVRSERSPAKSGLHVNFSEKGEVKERREKFLTAKYGSHQMSLIRKRLAVEMWLYDELQKLYEPSKRKVFVLSFAKRFTTIALIIALKLESELFDDAVYFNWLSQTTLTIE